MVTMFTSRRGFTLVELLITIAIISILASLALPAYDRYVRRTNRTAAKSVLQKIRGLEETYYTNNKQYTADMTKLGYTAASPIFVNKTSDEVASTSADAKYQVSVNLSGSTTHCSNCEYEIVAVPKNGQTADTDCMVFYYTSLGQKGAEDNSSTTTTNKCW